MKSRQEVGIYIIHCTLSIRILSNIILDKFDFFENSISTPEKLKCTLYLINGN